MKFHFLSVGAVLLCVCFSGNLSVGANSRGHHHHPHHAGVHSAEQVTLDLSPIIVQSYVLPDVTNDPARANFLRRMNLENGVEVRSTRWIKPEDVTTRNLFILCITQSLEGGFDSVNLYDKGVLSWGVMQWTAATDSLPPALIYIKRRLLQTGQKRVWDKVFVAQGLDVDRSGLIVFGKPLSSESDMRLAFRGTAIPGRYDPKVSGYWAKVMARAGRQPAIEKFQREYAQQKVDEVLTLPLTGVPCLPPGNKDVTVEFLTGGDPYAQALIFALWTNNPRHAQEYIADAARSASAVSHGGDPRAWKGGVFRESLIQRCSVSRFSNWKSRGQLIASRAAKLRSSDADGLYPYEVTYLMEIRKQAAHAAAQQDLLRLAAQRKKNPRLADRKYPVSPYPW